MLEKNYNHKKYEKKWYEIWENSGFFSINPSSAKKPYCIMMPPPNVTGNLHIGHALTFTLQDILIRYYRRNQYVSLWQPGMDHAGIATQMVVERKLIKKNIYRKDIGREKFLEEVWKWKEESGGMITKQLRALGSSPDWTRERFTMDEGLSEAVKNVFITLYNDGLIYRDKRLVNWDPKLQTAISDLEVENRENNSNLWYIKYPFKIDDQKFLLVATTRPETMLGDVAVAVHPGDNRYKNFIGQKLLLPLVGRELPIIADKYSDPNKGSGVVKITPAHDFNDFEVGQRHNLNFINILDKNAKITSDSFAREFHGLDRFEARNKIVSRLDEMGLIEKTEKIKNSVPYGDRSGVIIEPWLMDQWYVNAKKLAKPCVKAVKNGEMKFIPKNWENTFYEWMNNIQPWCISRQLWWGHRVPVWYGPDGKVFVGLSLEDAQKKSEKFYGKKVTLKQDEDVLDTWFSSALWPFSTLGWPKKTAELDKFYPGSVLVTGFDIIFFWVARMMMMGLYFMKDVPFKDIYIHALVRDEKGQKMSKSKGNVMDPLDLSDKYGADALRFTLAAMAAQGRDIKLSESRIAGYRNFSTKLWNACKFLEINNCVYNKNFDPSNVKNKINIWILSELQNTIEKVNFSIKAYRFNDSADAIYKFIWNSYCDWYVELLKPVFINKQLLGDEALLKEYKETAIWTLFQVTQLLNPFMPYITETLNKEFFKQKKLLIMNDWPVYEKFFNKTKNYEIYFLIDLITKIRSIKAELKIPSNTQLELIYKNPNKMHRLFFNEFKSTVLNLAKLKSCILTSESFPGGCAIGIIDGLHIALNIKDVMNLQDEIKRLNKEVNKLKVEIEMFENKLNNINFIKNAPKTIVEEIRLKLKSSLDKKNKIENSIKNINF